LNRNNRNKRLVSDSFETSFGSSFGCFESKLVSQDTLKNGKRKEAKGSEKTKEMKKKQKRNKKK
jgi:hypothetical protein